MIGYMNGVIIWTDNLPRLREFYCDTLGLNPTRTATTSSHSSGVGCASLSAATTVSTARRAIL